MRKIVALMALAASAPLLADAEPAPRTAFPTWLAGAWEQRVEDDWSEEFWSWPRGDMMIGGGRTGKGEELQFFEYMRIIRKSDGSLAFIAQPRGGPAVEFPMHETGPGFIEFVNPSHDYPQRIRYSRMGHLLMAETSKVDGGEEVRWNYRAVALDAGE